MQITVSVSATTAIVGWVVGALLITLAAFDVWRGGWSGISLMMLGSTAWLHGRLRQEANRMMDREDAAFNLGREAAVRSI